MKEDILEQIVEDWLISKSSTFTKTNVKFKPGSAEIDFHSKSHSNSSDIDIIAVNLKEDGVERVTVVSCKSWQGGFNCEDWVKLLTATEESTLINRGNKAAWKYFRELVKPIWAKAFVEKIFEETGQRSFRYILAVTKLVKKSNKDCFETCQKFYDTLSNAGAEKVEIELKTIQQILDDYSNPNGKSTTLV